MITAFLIFILFIIVAVSIAVIIRKKHILAGEWFRKLLHFICILLLGFLVFMFPTWKSAVIAMAVLVIVVAPVLWFLEKIEGFDSFMTARKSGEITDSLIITGIMFIIVTVVCAGIFGSRILVLTCIFAWGPGDAAAALVGKKYGRHKLGKAGLKSLEGTIAMFAVSFLCVFAGLLAYGKCTTPQIVLMAVGTALVASVTELISKGGMDTIICPLSSMLALLPMLLLSGNLQMMI